MQEKAIKMAIAFGGGGLRAAAHVGAVKFLEEQGVKITAVSGTSAGSMVALFVAYGLSSEDMWRFVKGLKRKELFSLWDFHPLKGPGLFSLDRLEKRLREVIPIKEYSALKSPLFVSVTEVDTAKIFYLSEGDPIANVVASCSLTPIFDHKRIGTQTFMDGGFQDNLPTKPLKALGHKVLALNLIPNDGTVPNSFPKLFLRSLLMSLQSDAVASRDYADLYVDMMGVADMGLFSFKAMDEAYESGYKEMAAKWEEIQERFVEISS